MAQHNCSEPNVRVDLIVWPTLGEQRAGFRNRNVPLEISFERNIGALVSTSDLNVHGPAC